jgi:penicillin-binding protein 1A
MASGGSDMAGPIWRNTMTKLLSGRQNIQFPMPSSIVQRAVCTSNGGLANKSGPNTYNEYFMAGALPTNSCNAEPTMISVCDTEKGQVISIDETKFDSATQSKDTANCKPPTEQVCEISSGKVITINTADYDSTNYSRDTTNCKAPATNNNKVEACDTTTGEVVTIPSSQLDGTRYTSDTQNCTKSTTTP